MHNQLDVYMPVVILIIFAIFFVVGALVVGHFLRPKNPTVLKNSSYECGEMPEGSAWSAFNIRFYIVGLIFIIFDVESTLLFPVAVVFKKYVDQGEAGTILVLFLLFVSILIEGIIYCWKKGDLEWVRSYQNVESES